ncbi:MAG: XRE family transcriptional regulator [Bacteroidetes bacterium RBG_13_44_24]|nr:MAG: XRE family transcriptional regulator [Bacteroidetes bacterium RBG_13_44_24]
MKPNEIILYPRAKMVLQGLGENLRLARLRRRLSTGQVSERADISRPTLNAIEKGVPTVSIGAYIKVLAVLGLEKDIAAVAKDDLLGRKMQDAGLTIRERAPKRKMK